MAVLSIKTDLICIGSPFWQKKPGICPGEFKASVWVYGQKYRILNFDALAASQDCFIGSELSYIFYFSPASTILVIFSFFQKSPMLFQHSEVVY
jgi:hypothetical protein